MHKYYPGGPLLGGRGPGGGRGTMPFSDWCCARLVATMRRPPLGRPAGRGAAPAGRRGTTPRGTSEAAGGGICIFRGGPWPPIDVIEPREPAEWSDWFEAMRLRTAISGGVGTSSEGGGAKADAVGLVAWALTRCVWTTMGPDGGIGGARTGAKLFAT